MAAKAFGSAATRALRSASGRADSRDRMVKAVRAACRRLRIDDDDRRAIQLDVTGKRSLSDMTLAELGKMLDRLNKDWKGPMGHRAHVGKIRALWWSLYWLGAVDQPNDAALDVFIHRQTGRARIQFIGSQEAFRVIEALKAMASRAGVAWPGDADLAELSPQYPHLTLPMLERRAVAAAIGVKLRDAGLIRNWAWWCEAALGLAKDYQAWSAQELDACIRELGKKWRRHLEKAAAE